MSDDIKTRLRAGTQIPLFETRTEALDRIEALEAENAMLRGALAGMIHVWEEISKAVPPMINQPEFLSSRAALEKDPDAKRRGQSFGAERLSLTQQRTSLS